MAQDLQRMEQALREAAGAGDKEAATRIAEAIRNRRAMGDQEPQPSPLKDETPPDPLATVPTMVGDVELDDNIRQMVFDARAIEDPKEQRLATARIAGRIAQKDESGSFANMVNSGQFGAGLRGFGAGVLGVGDLAAATGTVVGGAIRGDENPLSFGEALEAQRAFRRGLEEEFPGTSLTGEVAGAVAGGGAAVKLLSKAPAAVQTVAALQKGQRVKNIARVSLAGAAAGGVTEGVTEGDPTSGVVLGLTAGPLGVVLVKAAQITKAGIRTALEDPAARGIKALAKKMGVKSDEMMRRFMEFKTVTGKKPTMADLANNEAAAELRQMIASVPAASATARESVEAAQRGRGGEIAEQLTGGRVTTTRGAQEEARRNVAEVAFARAEADPIKFSRGEVSDLLNDPNLRDAMPRTLKRRFDEILEEAGDGPLTLTGLDVNDLRKALRKRGRGATGADQVFNELADEVEDIARKQSRNFATAIDEFAARSTRGEAVEAGGRVATARTGPFERAARSTDPNVGAGQRVGARSAVEDIAREGSQQADALVKKLSQDSGLVKRLRAVLPEAEVNKMQEIARLQNVSAQNLATLSPAVRANVERGIEGAVDDAVGGIIATTGGAGAGFKANVAMRILKRLIPGRDAVVENLARDLFDPSKTQQVITALRRAELSEEAILDLYAKVAVGSGAGAAATVN